MSSEEYAYNSAKKQKEGKWKQKKKTPIYTNRANSSLFFIKNFRIIGTIFIFMSLIYMAMARGEKPSNDENDYHPAPGSGNRPSQPKGPSFKHAHNPEGPFYSSASLADSNAKPKNTQKKYEKRTDKLSRDEAQDLFDQLLVIEDGVEAYKIFQTLNEGFIKHDSLQQSVTKFLTEYLDRALRGWEWDIQKIEELIKAGADVNGNNMRVYVKAADNPNKTFEIGRGTPIFIAINKNNLEAGRLFIKYKANVNVPLVGGEGEFKNLTPLLILNKGIPAESYEAWTKVLLEGNAEVNVVDEEGFSPLYYSVGANFNLNVVEALLKKGANVNIKIKVKLPPSDTLTEIGLLHYMFFKKIDFLSKITPMPPNYSEEAFLKLVRLLLTYKVDINQQDEMGNSVIFSISHFSKGQSLEDFEQDIRAVIEEGANPFLKNHEGKSAVDLNRPVLNKILEEPEIKAILKKNRYLDPREDAKIRREFSWLFEMRDGRVAYRKFKEIQEKYAESDLASRYERELTQCFFLGLGEWEWTVAELEDALQAGANANLSMLDFFENDSVKNKVMSDANDTPLFTAIKAGDTNLTKILLAHNAKVNIRLHNKKELKNMTPLHMVNAGKNIPNKKEFNALLLNHHANPNMRNSEGYTPSYAAAGSNDFNSLKALFAKGARPNVKLKGRGETYNIFKNLVFSKYDVLLSPQKSNVYSEEDFIKNLKLLVKNGYKLNAKNSEEGATALHSILTLYTGMNKHVEPSIQYSTEFLKKILRVMIRLGANPYIPNFSGKRPVDFDDDVLNEVLSEPETQSDLKKHGHELVDEQKSEEELLDEVMIASSNSVLFSKKGANDKDEETAYFNVKLYAKKYYQGTLTVEEKNYLSQCFYKAMTKWMWPFEKIKKIIEGGMDVNANYFELFEDDDFRLEEIEKRHFDSPLHVAIHQHSFEYHIEVNQLLIDHGASIEKLTKKGKYRGYFPLRTVIERKELNNQNKLIEMFLDEGYPINENNAFLFEQVISAFDSIKFNLFLDNYVDVDLTFSTKLASGEYKKVELVYHLFSKAFEIESGERAEPFRNWFDHFKTMLKSSIDHGLVDINKASNLTGMPLIKFILSQSRLSPDIKEKYLHVAIECGANPLPDMPNDLLESIVNDPKIKLILEKNGFHPERNAQTKNKYRISGEEAKAFVFELLKTENRDEAYERYKVLREKILVNYKLPENHDIVFFTLEMQSVTTWAWNYAEIQDVFSKGPGVNYKDAEGKTVLQRVIDYDGYRSEDEKIKYIRYLILLGADFTGLKDPMLDKVLQEPEVQKMQEKKEPQKAEDKSIWDRLSQLSWQQIGGIIALPFIGTVATAWAIISGGDAERRRKAAARVAETSQPEGKGKGDKEKEKERKKESPTKSPAPPPLSPEEKLKQEVEKEKISLENKITDLIKNVGDSIDKMKKFVESEEVLHAIEMMKDRQDDKNKLYSNIQEIVTLDTEVNAYNSQEKIGKSKLSKLKSDLRVLKKSSDDLLKKFREDKFKNIKERSILLKEKKEIGEALEKLEIELSESRADYLKYHKKWTNDIEEYENWVKNVAKSQAHNVKTSGFFAGSSHTGGGKKTSYLSSAFSSSTSVTTASATPKQSSSSTEFLDKIPEKSVEELYGFQEEDEKMPPSNLLADKGGEKDEKKQAVIDFYLQFSAHFNLNLTNDKKVKNFSIAYYLIMTVNAVMEMYNKDEQQNKALKDDYKVFRSVLVRHIFELRDLSGLLEEPASCVASYFEPIYKEYKKSGKLNQDHLKTFSEEFQKTNLWREAKIRGANQKQDPKTDIKKIHNALQEMEEILARISKVKGGLQMLHLYTAEYAAIKMLIVYIDKLYQGIRKSAFHVPKEIYMLLKENLSRDIPQSLHKIRADIAHQKTTEDMHIRAYIRQLLEPKLDTLKSNFKDWHEGLGQKQSEKEKTSEKASYRAAFTSSSSQWTKKQKETSLPAKDEEPEKEKNSVIGPQNT